MARKRDEFSDDPVVLELMAGLQRLGLRVQAVSPEQSVEHTRLMMEHDPEPPGTLH